MAAEPTPSQTVGPYFSFLLARHLAELVPPDATDAVVVYGRILDGAGEPVPDALVEIWQADEHGRYSPGFGWGRSGTNGEGRYSFVTRKPGRVADGNGGLQAPHLSFLVFARGLLKAVRTRMYFPEEDANADDRVLVALAEADRQRLVARARDSALEFDIRLQGDEQTTFFVV